MGFRWLGILTLLSVSVDSARPYSNFSTEIIVGNQFSQRAEVYTVTFQCDETCQPDPVDQNSLTWVSPNVSGISEVKKVIFLGEPAVLVTVRNGAALFSYETNSVLFGEEVCGQGIGTHSAEVLPDGSVAVVGTYQLFFLRHTPFECQNPTDTVNFFVTFGHGITLDYRRNKLYVLTYLSLEIFDLSNGPKRESSVSLEHFYLRPDHHESVHIADGGHDLYPVEGFDDILYLTTGERVLVFNTSNSEVSYHQLYYYLPSRHGSNPLFQVKFKGGVKAISRDPRYQLNFLHAAPWYEELYNETTDVDHNYAETSNHLIYSFENAECSKPNYDINDDCKVLFLDPTVRFYKARVFLASSFSYPVPPLGSSKLFQPTSGSSIGDVSELSH